ncbi:MAG: tetratricopeptide repeat protein [Woeseiaceae bacterium]|nr:tetratricopeptide repeat protein [Woeseiaceae bacterium]
MKFQTIDLGRERWQRVEELFHAAYDLDAAGQREFIERSCVDDTELRDYLLSLVGSTSDIDARVQQTIAETAGEAFTTSDSLHGEMIGPYRVERLIGSGGMGMVYLASRADEQYDQQVAIKLGRHRLVDPDTEIRLRNERQILADLDHPCIARLLDGGTTAGGVPYLVMEYIDGMRLDTYCDLHRLSITARLRLFQAICGAVDYAHRNLVIHRDIKPSNILVTEDGTPKLLDFGIAKLTDAHGNATDGLTRDGAVIMTPANAAPEQVLGQAVTTLTDVYALGLLLYTLLGGTRAYDVEDAPPGEFAQIVCRQSIVPPSVQLQQLHRTAVEASEAIAKNRSTSPERLLRVLRGDLDTIVVNALRKTPERRYRTAGALANDIDLHLASKPIQARGDSWRYRAGKFVRRHYAAVSVSAAVVAMLAVFTVVLLVQNRTVIRERDTAREVSQFLEDIFMAQDPAQARGASITADELLASGAARIRTNLGGRPEVQAPLMGTIGRVYFNLGEYEESVPLLEDALELRLAELGDGHPEVAAIKNDLAEALIQVSDYARAAALLNEALEANRNASGATSLAVAENLFNLADLHLKRSDYEPAEAYAVQSIEIYQRHADSHGVALADAKSMLARILQVRGDLERTESLLLEAINILIDTEGDDHPHLAYYLQNLGVLQRTKGDFDAAEATFERAIEATRRILGEQHPLVAATLVNQGTLLQERGDLAAAERVLREALRSRIESRGAAHPMVGYDMTSLGMLLHDREQLEAAEDMLRGALDVYAATLGDDHQYTASALTELGAVLNSLGRLEEARVTLERALAIRVKDYPPDHELVAGTRVEYADTLTRLGLYDDANALLQQSLAALGDRPGRRTKRAYAALARLQDIATADGDL